MMRSASFSAVALMSSDKRLRRHQRRPQVLLVLAMFVEHGLHASDLLAKPVGFAERLLVVVGDGRQEGGHLDLVEAAEAEWKRCWRRSRGLTFMRVISPLGLSADHVRGRQGLKLSRGGRRSRFRPGRGGPLLDGDFEVVAHAHGQLASACWRHALRLRAGRGAPRSLRNYGGGSGSSTAGGSSISPHPG